MSIDQTTIQSAQAQLDAHTREIIAWHFSPESGCPYWLDWAKKNFDPRKEVNSFADLIAKFPHFQDESLRDMQPEVWVPAQFKGKPFNIFETGGTTGMPKQRIGWNDYKVDYSEFSEKISDEHFPRNHYWLMMGPTGPRRLRLAIEHLANVRGSSCYFIDLDPRFVKKVISNKQFEVARAYMDHVVDRRGDRISTDVVCSGEDGVPCGKPMMATLGRFGVYLRCSDQTCKGTKNIQA